MRAGRWATLHEAAVRLTENRRSTGSRLRSAMTKLSANSRPHAVALALSMGLIGVREPPGDAVQRDRPRLQLVRERTSNRQRG